METDGEAQPTDPVTLVKQKVHHILTGEASIKLHLEFLCRNNQADMLILKNTKVDLC